MERTVFRERLPGFKVEQVIRSEEFHMAARHMHSEYEIYYLAEGELQYFLEGEELHLCPGTLCFIDCEKIHRTSSVSGRPYTNRILMEVNPEWLNDFFKAVKQIPRAEFFQKCCVVHLDKEEQRQVVDLFFAVAEEARSRKIGCELVVKSKLAELLVIALRAKQREEDICAENPSKAAISEYSYSKINEVAEYIRHNCQEKISLQSLSEQFFMSKAYLSRSFKEGTNFTVNEYLTVQRLKRARRLLETTKYNMTQVSEESGFESVSYFEKVFKKHMGLTPLKYRRLRQTSMPQK